MAAQAQESPRSRTETGQEPVLAEGQRGELASHTDSETLARHHPHYGQEGQERTVRTGSGPDRSSWSFLVE